MKILRTPDSQFENLPGYPFKPNYIDSAGIRIHYVDEGAKDAPVVLMLHGEPSWSYLYRHMIPVIVDAGFRAIAPDLVGFGRSDKPSEKRDYTYQRHVDWMRDVLFKLELKNITLMCQDWGGLIGLRLAAEHPDLFDRIVAANTFLPTGDFPMPAAFKAWQRTSQLSPWFPVGKFIQGGTKTRLPKDVVAAYNAPFPDESYKAGAKIFPMLVPTSPNDPATVPNRKAWEVLKQWEKPFLTAFSDGDPITQGADEVLRNLIPGTQGQDHTIIRGGGHFLQEDRGLELARVVTNFIRKTC